MLVPCRCLVPAAVVVVLVLLVLLGTVLLAMVLLVTVLAGGGGFGGCGVGAVGGDGGGPGSGGGGGGGDSGRQNRGHRLLSLCLRACTVVTTVSVRVPVRARCADDAYLQRLPAVACVRHPTPTAPLRHMTSGITSASPPRGCRGAAGTDRGAK